MKEISAEFKNYCHKFWVHGFLLVLLGFFATLILIVSSGNIIDLVFSLFIVFVGVPYGFEVVNIRIFEKFYKVKINIKTRKHLTIWFDGFCIILLLIALGNVLNEMLRFLNSSILFALANLFIIPIVYGFISYKVIKNLYVSQSLRIT